MTRNRKVIIGVAIAVVVLGGLGLLGWGEAVYRRSQGERGWSLGAATYSLLGWDADTYLADFPRSDVEADEVAVQLLDDDGDGVPDRGSLTFETESSARRGLFGRSKHADRGVGPSGGLRGLARLALLGLLIGLGVVWYRRRQDQREPDEPDLSPSA